MFTATRAEFWEYAGAFTIELVRGTDKDFVPSSAVVSGDEVYVPVGMVYWIPDVGIQCVCREGYFSTGLSFIRSIRDESGNLLWPRNS